MFDKNGVELSREALQYLQRIDVQESKPTPLQTLPTRAEATKVLKPDGQIVILRNGKKYRMDGLRIKE